MSKICNKCNTILEENNNNFCPICGNNLSKQNTKKSGFINSIKNCYKNYFNFKGRAKLSEFWWFWLYRLIIIILIALVFPENAFKEKTFTKIVDGILFLSIQIPYFAVWCRRLHDIGTSARWILYWWLIGIFGGIIVRLALIKSFAIIFIYLGGLILFCGLCGILFLWARCSRAGMKGENKYGPEPE